MFREKAVIYPCLPPHHWYPTVAKRQVAGEEPYKMAVVAPSLYPFALP
jgi:hypothetical protein